MSNAIIIETKRLILREIQTTDRLDMFEMDSDPCVHQYIFNQPVQSIDEIDEAIKFIQSQYQSNNIGRWAVLKKDTLEMIGWCGLKYVTDSINNQSNFYDLGYRLKKKHWGKGYTTEGSIATLKYGKDKLGLKTVTATVHPENLASIQVLKKLGFNFGEIFDYEGSASIFCDLDLNNFNSEQFEKE